MALITKIRGQFWLILILLGFALAAFIMMDANSFGGGGGGNLTLGKVNGEKLDWNEFQLAENAMFSNSRDDVYNTRTTLWNHFVDKSIVEDEGQANGIVVSDEDLQDLKTGTRLSPVVQSFFQNQQTGQFDRNFYNNFIQRLNSNNVDAQTLRQWEYLDNFIKKDHIENQLVNMTTKGVYSPSWMAEENYKSSQSSVDFNYVKIAYDQLPDVEVTDADFNSYLKDHSAEYENINETREIEYAILEAIPTALDSVSILGEMIEIRNGLASAENDSTYVEQFEGSLPATYFKPDGLSADIRDVAYTMAVGDIHGPYISDGSYRLMKLVDKQAIPDSVEVRHILRRVQTTEEVAPAQALVDSLINVLNTGQNNFDSLALIFSQDGSAQVGGYLGMTAPGAMVPQFNDLIFYQAEVGKVYKVATQFGFHIVEVLKHKYDGTSNRNGVRLARVAIPITPSEDTQNAVLEQANVLLSSSKNISDLVDNGENQGYRISVTNPLESSDFLIPGLTSSQTNRDLIQWAFSVNTDIGDVAPEVYIYDNAELYYNQNFVIAGLKSITPEGLPPLDNVREILRPSIINEKKARSITAESSTGKSLVDIANQYDVEMDTVRVAKYNSRFIPGLGNEPLVLAAAIKGNIGEVTGPVQGNAGIYYVNVKSKIDNPEISNLSFYRRTSSLGTRTSAKSQVIRSMREAADIEDSRSTFY